MTTGFIERSFYSLGTLNNIKIYNCNDESVLDISQNRVNELDDLLSAFKPNSDISKLNSNSGKGYVEIHKDTFMLLSRSIEFSKMSSGAFDISIRPLVELWGIGKKNNFIPSTDEISKVRKLVNYKNIMLDSKNKMAALLKEGQAIDLGGIAKGFAADEVKRILLERNIESAIINLGGNIVTIGNKPDGNRWKIGIQNPLSVRGQNVGVLPITNKAIVTSGSNERFFIKDGVRYHHIIDPRTGIPSNSSILSVTVVSDCSMDADALTTSLFILGPEALFSSSSAFGDLQFDAVFITEELELIATDGIRQQLTK